jgi:hypothetical protein
MARQPSRKPENIRRGRAFCIGKSGAGAAQGDLFTEAYEPGKS